MKGLLAVSLILPFAHGCSSKSTEDEDSGDSTRTETVDSQLLFKVTGELLDLAIAPDGRIFASIQEHSIDIWDPETEWVETHTDRAGAVFGISWFDGTLWYTTSNHRHSGALMKLDGKDGVTIAIEMGNTVFREPRDLCRTSDGQWIIADTTLGALFVISDDGTSVERMGVPLSDVATVACDSHSVYVGGEDGVVRIPWPDGTPDTIDSRPVDGLHSAKGIVWGTNTDLGVFEVNGDRRLDLPDLTRAGRMAGDDSLLIADSITNEVWLVNLSDID